MLSAFGNIAPRSPIVLIFGTSVLGLNTTSTVQVTTVTTEYVTNTAFFSQGTTFDGATRTANAAVGPVITTTVTGNAATITTCNSSDPRGLANRQISIGININLSLPSVLASDSPSQVSIICDCLQLPTPQPYTTSIVETTVSEIVTTINVVLSHTNTVYITPTITPVRWKNCPSVPPQPSNVFVATFH